MELWEDIRSIYRDDLQKAWRRIFGLKKLKAIIPIEVHDLATFNPTLSRYEHYYKCGSRHSCSQSSTRIIRV